MYIRHIYHNVEINIGVRGSPEARLLFIEITKARFPGEKGHFARENFRQITHVKTKFNAREKYRILHP